MGFFVTGVVDRGVLKFKVYRQGKACAVFTLDRLIMWLDEMKAKEKARRIS